MRTHALDDAAAEVVSRERPWPRLRAYDEKEEQFFHGRSRETSALLRQVMRDNLTVFFGISGIGKTSLLRAGLFPRLRQEGFFPVRVRLDFADPETNLVEQVKREFEAEIGRHGLQVVFTRSDGLRSEHETLWQYFHSRRVWDRADMLTPVLVLDQFEELFTLGDDPSGAEPVSALVTELADLVENQIPRSLRDWVERTREPLPFASESHPAQVVLSLREDYLAYLEALVPLMPSLKKGNRFRLLPMSGMQALDAVLKPGIEIIEDAEARDLVFRISYMRQSGGREEYMPPQPDDRVLDHRNVEPFLLSLVCTELNEQRIAQGGPKITRALLDTAAGGVRAILQKFYEDCLKGVPDAVRIFVEELLVSPAGYRQPVALDDVRTNPEIAQSLEALVNRRLIRKEEDRRGVQRIELVHDVLTPIAVESRNRRHVAAHERRVWETQRTRWKRYGTIALTVLAALAIVASALAVRNGARAQRAAEARAKEAEQAALTERQLRAVAEEERARAAQAIKEAIESAKVSAQSYQQAANRTTDQREKTELQYRAQTELSVANRSAAPESGLRPRVYVHVRDREQENNARERLGTLSTGTRFVVPGIEVLAQGPNRTEVRYFRRSEESGAAEIVAHLERAGITNVRSTFVAGYEESTRIRPGHYEVWFAPDALR